MLIIDYLMGLAGTENQLIKIIKHIDSSAFDIHLVCLLDSQWLTEIKPQFDCEVTALRYDMFNHKKLANLLSVVELIRVIRSSRPAIVFTFFKTSYILGPIAARLAGVRTVVSTRRDFGLWLKNKWSIFLIRFSNFFVTRIAANSHAVAELAARAEKFDKERIDVIYNGIDIGKAIPGLDALARLRKQIGIPQEAQVVGIVAGLKPMKRHETLFQAARRLVEQRDNLHFVVVGDGVRRCELVSYVEELELTHRIHFVGNQEDVLPYLAMFDIGINCSANEGLSNAIMEYMAYGVPCIVSHAGGNFELIEDGVNGYTFELGDDGQLAYKILRLLEDPERRERYATESKKRIEASMSTDRMIANYEAYIRKILNRNGTGQSEVNYSYSDSTGQHSISSNL